MHSISLQSSDSSIAVNDILGRIGFAASNETGSDALKVSALILAVAEGTFDSTNNPTSLTFSTGNSETATEKMRLTSTGSLGINTTSPTKKLQVVRDAQIDDVIVGEWDGGATYGGLTHKDYLSSAYMMISNGASNFISCGAGGITYIRGASNNVANGEIRLSSGQVVVNETGANVDFRVEGDTDANLIRADASADNVGIGYYLPSEKLQVHGTVKVSNGGGLGREDDGVHMAFPGGAMDKNSGSTQTGYLKVSLPTSWSNTMIMFDLDVYEYNPDGLAGIRRFKLCKLMKLKTYTKSM